MNANVRGLRPEEIESVSDLVARAYAEKRLGSDRVVRAINADPEFDPELNRVVEVDGKLVARLCIHDRMMYCDGGTLRVGAIGGVCTDPAYRGKGFCKILLNDATQFMKAKGFDVSLLFGAPAVYGTSGWQTLVTYGIKANLPIPITPGITIKQATLSHDGDVLKSLYQQFNPSLTGPFVRSSEYWNCWIGNKLDVEDSWRIWLVYAKTEPIGYFIDRADHAGMVHEIAWSRQKDAALPCMVSAIAKQLGTSELRFQLFLPEIRDAILNGVNVLSLEDLGRQEYVFQITMRYSGLFKLINSKSKALGDVHDTAALLQFFRHRNYVFWGLDSF